MMRSSGSVVPFCRGCIEASFRQIQPSAAFSLFIVDDCGCGRSGTAPRHVLLLLVLLLQASASVFHLNRYGAASDHRVWKYS